MKNAFWREYSLPNCVGIIDGTHYPVKCPKGKEEAYHSFKGWISLNALVLIDHKNMFRYVFACK